VRKTAERHKMTAEFTQRRLSARHGGRGDGGGR
jgi:hypothetical protein